MRQPAARQLLVERPGEHRLELLDRRIVAHAVERQFDHRLHRRAQLNLQALRLDQPEIFLGAILGVESEVIGGTEALVERRIGAQLGEPRLIGDGPDLGEFVLQRSLRFAARLFRLFGLFGRLLDSDRLLGLGLLGLGLLGNDFLGFWLRGNDFLGLRFVGFGLRGNDLLGPRFVGDRLFGGDVLDGLRLNRSLFRLLLVFDRFRQHRLDLDRLGMEAGQPGKAVEQFGEARRGLDRLLLDRGRSFGFRFLQFLGDGLNRLLFDLSFCVLDLGDRLVRLLDRFGLGLRFGLVRLGGRLGRFGRRLQADEGIDVVDPGATGAERKQHYPATRLSVVAREIVFEGQEIARNGDDRQLLGDAGKDRLGRGIHDPLGPVMAAAKRLAEMANLGVMPAADQLEQRAVRAGVGQFQRVKVVERREFLVAANRQPIIEHAGVLAPLGRLDCLERTEQRLCRRLIACLHPRRGRPHVRLRLSSRGGLWAFGA